jgi:hypothetical protein
MTSVREAFDENRPLPESALAALDYINRKDAAIAELEAERDRLSVTVAHLYDALDRIAVADEAGIAAIGDDFASSLIEYARQALREVD